MAKKDAVRIMGVKFTAEGAKDFVKSSKETGEELKKVSREFDIQISKLDKKKDADEIARLSLEKTTKKLSLQQERYDKLNEVIERSRKENKLSKEELLKLENGLLGYEKQIINTTKEQEKLNKTVSNIDSNKAKLGTAGNVLTAVGTAGVGAATTAINAYEDLKKSENAFVKAVGTSKVNISEYKDAMRDIFSNNTVTYDVVTETMTSIVRQLDITKDDAKKTTELFIKLGKATGDSASSLTSTLIPAFKQMGIETKDYEKTIDLLVATSQNSNISVSELGGILKDNQATLNGFGLSLEEQVSLLGSFSKAGLDASSGVSELGKALPKLVKRGESVEGAFQRITSELTNLKNNDDALQSKAQEYFGAKVGKDIAEAIKQGAFELDNFQNMLGDTSGTLSKTMAEVETPLSSTFKKLKNTITVELGNLGEEFSDDLITIAKELAGALKSGVEVLKNPAVKTFVVTLLKLSPFLLLLGGTMKAVSSGIGLFNNAKDIVGVFSKLVGDGGLLTGIFTKLPALLSSVTSGIASMASSFMAAIPSIIATIGPFLLIAAAVIAVLATLYIFRDEIAGFFENIIGFFQNVKTFLVDNLGSFGEAIYMIFINPIASIFEALKKIFDGIIQFISGVFSGNWGQAWNGIMLIFGGVFDGLVAIAKAPINAIIGLINILISGLNLIKLPSWVPGIGGMGINIPTIPYLAKGGIVRSETHAVVGEAGQEAIIPMTNGNVQREIADWVVAGVRDVMGMGASGNSTVVVNLDGRTIATEISPALNGLDTKQFNVSKRSNVYAKK